MKKIIAFIMAAILFLSMPTAVYAAKQEEVKEIYDQQLSVSGADDLYYSLPEETKRLLSETGMNDLSYDTIRNFDGNNIIQTITKLAGEKSRSPFSSFFVILGVMLLCSMLEGTNITLGENPLKKNLAAVGALCISTSAVLPICQMVERCTEVIQGASGFMALYVPVMTGLMVSSSHQLQGASYYTTLMGTSELIGLMSSRLIVPFINVFLSLSVTASLSPSLKLTGICSAINRCLKWILNFSLGIFVTILSSQSLVTSSMDEVSTRAVRFAMNSFVPVVGSVLSETVSTFSGSLSMLKSGTGIFVIIASACIFLPVLIECLFWRILLYLSGAVSQMLGLESIRSVLQALETVISLLMAVLLTIIMIFIISTVIVLITGRQ